MKFFGWGGERGRQREPEPQRERRGVVNRERLIAKMAGYYNAHDNIQHFAGGGDARDGDLKRIREMYQTLRGIVVDSSFDSATLDELIGAIYSRELASAGTDSDILEHIRKSLTADDAISAATIRNVSNGVSDKMRAATGYGRIVYGIGEPIAYLPADGSKKQPIYLGSRVRYATKMGGGDSGIARIISFVDPNGVFENPDSTAFQALTKPDPTKDMEVQFPLRISEIVDLYDE
ncbi:hypothetical protein HY622_04310 [Candidatus Uhrbacteria bacterium]|nr:hypothetical protein [Candidatus Uhrbacteria bacterium]